MSLYSSLHFHTNANPHKVSDITQRYLQKCRYQFGAYSQRTACLRLLISALSVSVCWGGETSGAAQGVPAAPGVGTGASRDWTLSSGVNRRAGLRAHQECSRLISF